jgi:MOSC domain-containing protein
MTITLDQIYRYPVKGLTPEPLAQIRLAPGEGLPQDRRFALGLGTNRFDPAAPAWMPKVNFLMLMKNEKLARLRARFDAASGVLAISTEGKEQLRADLGTAAGRSAVEDFFAAYMGEAAQGRPRLLEAPGHMFSDNARKVVSIIGLSSLSALAETVGRALDPRRFRANFYLAGSAPWQEFDWIGRDFAIGGVKLRGFKAIRRCAATNVEPESGARDLNLPLALSENFGHVNMGIYAEVIEGGEVSRGAALAPPG